MLTLLTATGCRPETFALCKRWMAAQTYAGPVRWIVVDDGEEAVDLSDACRGWKVDHVRREPYWCSGQNTQAANLLTGLDRHEDGPLVIIEDDDYYAPNYLEVVSQWLDLAELVGERSNRYYHVGARRWRDNRNMNHASLCSTAVRGPAIEALRQACADRPTYIDMKLWKEYAGSKFLADTRLTVGMKGLPGRPGIGAGHQLTRGTTDLDGEILRAWIGSDADAYLKFSNSLPPRRRS